MRVSRSEYFVANVGAIALGVVLAMVLAYVTGYLWPVMSLPVFVVAFLWWAAFALEGVLRDDGRREVGPTTFKQERAENLGKGSRLTRSGRITMMIGNLLVGGVVAPLIAGIVGLLWPGGRWLIFFIVLTVWLTLIIWPIVHERVKRAERSLDSAD